MSHWCSVQEILPCAHVFNAFLIVLEEILIFVVLDKTGVSLFTPTGTVAIGSQELSKQERQRQTLEGVLHQQRPVNCC